LGGEGIDFSFNRNDGEISIIFSKRIEMFEEEELEINIMFSA